MGKTIALLAEEGDDISNLEVPADEPAPSPKASQPTPEPPKAPTPSSPKSETPVSAGHHVPHHSRPLFPSVLRLIQEHSISQGDVDKINGTGVRGMLTKGDILTHLGLASGPSGTYREASPPDAKTATKADAKAKEVAPLDGLALRRLIVGNMLDVSIKARAAAGAFSVCVRSREENTNANAPQSQPSSQRVDRLRLCDLGLPPTIEAGPTCFCFGCFAAQASDCSFLRRIALVYLRLFANLA